MSDKALIVNLHLRRGGGDGEGICDVNFLVDALCETSRDSVLDGDDNHQREIYGSDNLLAFITVKAMKRSSDVRGMCSQTGSASSCQMAALVTPSNSARLTERQCNKHLITKRWRGIQNCHNHFVNVGGVISW